MLEPCNKPFIKACKKYLALKSIILQIKRHDLAVVSNMDHEIHHPCIEFEEQDSKYLWGQSSLDHLREGRSFNVSYGFLKLE